MNLDAQFLKNNSENKQGFLQKIRGIIAKIMKETEENLHPMIIEVFEDKDLAQALFETQSEDAIKEYIIHSNRFSSFLSQEKTKFLENIERYLKHSIRMEENVLRKMVVSLT